MKQLLATILAIIFVVTPLNLSADTLIESFSILTTRTKEQALQAIRQLPRNNSTLPTYKDQPGYFELGGMKVDDRKKDCSFISDEARAKLQSLFGSTLVEWFPYTVKDRDKIQTVKTALCLEELHSRMLSENLVKRIRDTHKKHDCYKIRMAEEDAFPTKAARSECFLYNRIYPKPRPRYRGNKVDELENRIQELEAEIEKLKRY